MARKLAPGLYESPVTTALEAAVADLAEHLRQLDELDPDTAPALLASGLHRRIVEALKSVGGGSADKRVAGQLELANRLLDVLVAHKSSGARAEDRYESKGRVLRAIFDESDEAFRRKPLERPQIALTSSDLLVNGRNDVSIGPVVKRELQSADRVDLLVSFLKWSGVRVILPELTAFLRRRPGAMRVLTTVYMGATQAKAVEALQQLGAEVRVSHDTERTRLHAKAWLFHRESGFSTAFIGSSNLSHAALVDGAEWNVRLSRTDNGPILERFETTFNQYWDDPEYEPYDAARFRRAVKREQGNDAFDPLMLRLDLQPKSHQEKMLDELAAERQRGYRHNLVVAATGTGKTFVAAFDTRRLLAQHPSARVLFVAHRKEILEQARSVFRVVIRDGAFGAMWVAGETPGDEQAVFASIQTLNAFGVEGLDKRRFDIVIVDEFHHAPASSYTRLLEHLEPTYLLGLTATPERADGADVLRFFDGRIASELRLWDALDAGLLAPFQYFGIGAAPDATGVTWSGGRYKPSELSALYTADHIFARRVVQETERHVADVGAMRALGFCVDVAHAEFMAAQFCEAGIVARAVSGQTARSQRSAALQALRSGETKVVFSVDLFNEGVDIPDVDTVIFLRPTESATVFLQQLGRGLRRTPDKECLTVLDFIGRAHRRFRFDVRYRAIVGGTRKHVERQVELGFPYLPSGCAIVLDKAAQSSVLDNIKRALHAGRQGLVDDLRAVASETDGAVSLAMYLSKAEVEIDDVYAGQGRGWTELRRRAGLVNHNANEALERAIGRMVHIADAPRIVAFRTLVHAPSPPVANPADPAHRAFHALLSGRRAPHASLGETFAQVWVQDVYRKELVELLEVLDDRSRALTTPDTRVPLEVHAEYTLAEVMAAFDERTKKGAILLPQTGVYHARAHKTDLFFVTLEKSEKDFTPTTLYRDFPVSPSRFHWETQSSCHPGTPTGRRYLRLTRGAEERALLFVRRTKKDDRGETSPYLFLGRCFYVSHRDERPMSILWDLEHRMPPAFWQETKRAAG